MSPARTIPKLFWPSFHAMASPIWCHRAIKLHKHGLSVPSPQAGLGCTCLAYGDFSDFRALVSDKPCLLYSSKYVQYVPFSQNSVSEKEKKRRQGIRSDSVHGAPFTLCFPAGSWVTRSLYCTDSHQPWEGHWAPSSHCQNMKMLICYFCGLGSYEKKGTNFNFKNGGVMSMCPLKLGSPWSVNFWTLLGFGFLWCKGRLLWWVVQFLGI